MHTTSSPTTRSTPMVPTRMAVPPPVTMDLRHGDTVVGWIDGLKLGFVGFGDEAEAAHAALVAYRTVERRFARDATRRPLPIEIQPMSISRTADTELILAAGLPIARLVRPGADSPTGPDHFGFEIEFPVPADELVLRSTAYRAYHTLRRSGIRWTMWARDRERAVPTFTDVKETAAPIAEKLGGGVASTGAPTRPVGDDPRIPAGALVALALVVLATLVVAPGQAIVAVLGGVAALIALAAVAGLVHYVVSDVRGEFPERIRERGRAAGRNLRQAASFRGSALSDASMGRHYTTYHAARRAR